MLDSSRTLCEIFSSISYFMLVKYDVFFYKIKGTMGWIDVLQESRVGTTSQMMYLHISRLIL